MIPLACWFITLGSRPALCVWSLGGAFGGVALGIFSLTFHGLMQFSSPVAKLTHSIAVQHLWPMADSSFSQLLASALCGFDKFKNTEMITSLKMNGFCTTRVTLFSFFFSLITLLLAGQSWTQCKPMPLPALGTQKIIQGNGTSVGTVISLQCPDKHELIGNQFMCIMGTNSSHWVGEPYCRRT